MVRTFGGQSRAVAEKLSGTAGTVRAADRNFGTTDEFIADGFQRAGARAAGDFVPTREVTFRPSQVVSNTWRAQQRFKKPVLIIDYPVGDAAHAERWASGKYLYDGEDHGYSVVRSGGTRNMGATDDGLELDGAPWVRRWPPEKNTFVRSRSLAEPVDTGTAQAPVGTPGRQRLLTVRTGWRKTETVAVDDETLLKVQAANKQLARAVRDNEGPVVLLPDKSFPRSADSHIENLRTSLGSPEIYAPTGDVSTTIADPTTLPLTNSVVPGRTGIEVHDVDVGQPAWTRSGAKPGTREWWADPRA
ncbi:hypothetical protein ACWCPQ_32540 [Nocardia sp. NPDC001965]